MTCTDEMGDTVQGRIEGFRVDPRQEVAAEINLIYDASVASAPDIWSTLVNFHAGDAATVWGVTPQDFALNWVDGAGATGFTGLTLHAAGAGRPTASLTLPGYSSADLSDGRLSVSFGTDPASGSSYMYVYGNS